MKRLAARVGLLFLIPSVAIFAFDSQAQASSITQNPANVIMLAEEFGTVYDAAFLGANSGTLVTGGTRAGAVSLKTGSGGFRLGNAVLNGAGVIISVASFGAFDFGSGSNADESGLPVGGSSGVYGITASGYIVPTTQLAVSGSPLRTVGAVTVQNTAGANKTPIMHVYCAAPGQTLTPPTSTSSTAPVESSSLWSNAQVTGSLTAPGATSSVGPVTCSGSNPTWVAKLVRFGTSQTSPLYSWSDLGATAPSADRYVEQTVTCRNSSGVDTDIVATSGALPAITGANQSLASIPAVDCPDGSRLVGAQTDLVTDGTATVVELHPDYTAPDTVMDIPQECVTGSTDCVLLLEYLTTVAGVATWLSCFEAGYGCADWHSVANKALVYRCTYGATSPVEVLLSACNVYKDTFKPGGAEYTWPEPTTDPETDPGDCSLGWGDLLNGSIVYKAVSCALKWAFVPPAGTFEALGDQLAADFNATAIGTVYEAGDDILAPVVSAEASTDCGGPVIDASPVGLPDDFRPLNTCGEGAAEVMAFWLPLSAVIVYIGVFFNCARILMRVFGIQPGPLENDASATEQKMVH